VSDVPEPSDAQEAVRDARDAVEKAETGVEEAQEAVRQLEKYEEQRDRLSDRLESERSELEQANAKLDGLDVPAFDATRLAQLEQEIDRREEIAEKVRRLEARASRIPELQEDIERWVDKKSQAKERAERALEKIEELDFSEHRYQELTEELEARREKAQACAEELSRARAEKEAAETRLQRARDQLEAFDERAERVEAVEEEHRLHVRADERLSAFRAAEAQSVRPELEELVSAFLGVLTDGRHDAVRLTEDFDVRVLEHGEEQEVVSGGAEDVSAIALRLAISQLIAERAGHPLSLLVLDEPFGSLDAVRRQNVLELIETLGDVFEQVLLITHVEEVQDAVDHAFRFAYDEAEGISRVTLEQTTRMEAA
jgi:exonuclease SbcC